MASVLLVGTEPDSLAKIEEVAEQHGLRARSVVRADNAKEWLGMQQYEAMLVDARFPNRAPIELIQFGWKQNPMMVGGIFNLEGDIPDQMEATFIGIRTYSGMRVLENIGNTFEVLAGELVAQEEFPVLLVEDLDSPRDILQAYIEGLGYPRVDGAKSAPEALELLKEKEGYYSRVVTDINMPKVKGTELVKQIREDDGLKHLPVIVLSAYATAENLLECLRAGATGFLVKPPRKKALQLELEKARRILMSKQSPRLCQPEDTPQLEIILDRINLT